jgi:hypothetical protein
MATQTNFSIRKGRTCTIVVTITGITIWTDLIAKLVAAYDMESSVLDIELTGYIDPVAGTATFNFTPESTEELEAQTSLRYEVTIYKTDGSYVKDSNYGLLNIAPAVKIDPTT